MGTKAYFIAVSSASDRQQVLSHYCKEPSMTPKETDEVGVGQGRLRSLPGNFEGETVTKLSSVQAISIVQCKPMHAVKNSKGNRA